MGLVQDVEVRAAAWVLKEELPAALRAGAAGLLGILASAKVAPVLAAAGVTIDPNRFAALVVSLGTGAGVAAVLHLAGGWLAHTAYGRNVTVLAGALAPAAPAPSLELQADKPSPLAGAPKDTEAPLK